MPDWPTWAINSFVVALGTTLTVAAVQYFTSSGSDASSSKESDEKPSGDKVPAFRAFQRQYLIVYYIIMLADWLQGTNMYTLYKGYGVDISALFITGFASG